MIHQRLPEGIPVYSVAYASPFSGEQTHVFAERGPSIGELVAATPGLPDGFAEHGEVRINGALVPREQWCWTRPRPGTAAHPVCVTLHMAPRGGQQGGDSGGKAIVGIVAALALTIATAGIAGGALAGGLGATLTGGLFSSGGALAFLGTGVGAQALAFGVGLAGALALGALTKPPTSDTPDRKVDNRGAASASGNVIGPGEALPRVIGTYRVFPPYITDAHYEVIDQDEYVTLVCALAGPHKLEAIRIGDADIATAEDVTYETREGWDTDTALTLATKQCRITGASAEINGHIVDPDYKLALKNQTTPALSLPQWQTVATRHAPDRVRLRLDFPQGLGSSKTDNEDDFAMIPLRVEIRPRGATTWTKLPELFVASRRTDPKKFEIVLDWTTEPGTVPTPPAQAGFPLAYRAVPTQSIAPVGAGGMTAHPYFSDPTKTQDYLSSANLATSGVRHTHLTSDRATFYLDPALFPKTTWEIRIRRGMIVPKAAFNGTTYQLLSVAVYDFFGYYTSGGIHRVYNDDGWFGSAYLVRCQSEWDAAPVAAAGDALIAIRAKNRAVDGLSVLASGYVPDIGNLAGPWITTSNPAHHYRFVLAGTLNADPLPTDLVDDDALADWRDSCDANGYTCDAIVQGDAIMDTLSMLAACGYARPVQSEVWGVYEDRDRSAEPPVQIFSPRNAANFRWEKAFPRLPDGFRVTYPEGTANYEDQQLVVMRAGATGANLEGVTYKGVTTAQQALARANFDLAQAEARSTFYYLDAPPEAIVCRRGDLVGVTHDVLTRQAGAGRVLSKTVAAGNITALTLDCAVEIAAGDPAFGIIIRRADGTFSTHAITNGAGEHQTVTLATPIANSTVTVTSGFDAQTVPAVGEGDAGALVVWGPVTQETARMLVFGVAPNDDGSFALTLVDEAPDLVRTAAGSFDAPGSRVIDTAGSYYFVVPNYEHTLTVTLVGGSAGAHGVSSASTFPAGTAGGDTTFRAMVAGGSPVPASRTTAGAGGTATGGDTNAPGNAGAAPGTSSGAGGDTPGIPGSGGPAVAVDGNGVQGSAPGAGASGSRRRISGTVYATSGTGSGGVVIKTYTRGAVGAPVPGTVEEFTVGAGGLAGDGATYDGGAGRVGRFGLSWA